MDSLKELLKLFDHNSPTLEVLWLVIVEVLDFVTPCYHNRYITGNIFTQEN